MSETTTVSTALVGKPARRISEAFVNKKAFIAYLMAGDPNLEVSADLIVAAAEAGADLIEIGIPFSDPIAEGSVIQAAATRALGAGTRLDGVFDMVASLAARELAVPLVFMTYLNPVFVYGYDRFFSRCAEIGIAGIIIPDLPFEEQGEVIPHAHAHGVEVVTLVAPTSEERIAHIAASAEGFLYLVSSMGVTGVRSEITTDIASIMERIRSVSAVPVAVGFGISTTRQASEYSALADGVIVGSAIVRLVGEHGSQAARPVAEYIRAMKAAMTDPVDASDRCCPAHP